MPWSWICMSIGILVCLWGLGAVLSQEVRDWSRRSIPLLASIDVLIGGFLIFVGIFVL